MDSPAYSSPTICSSIRYATHHQPKPAPLSALSSCSQHTGPAEQARLMEMRHCNPMLQVFLLHARWHDALP